VALVRRYKTELGSLDEAVNRAVDECIRNDVLADFLKRNRAEVVMMSIFEYNQEEEERKLRAAERQAGYASGVEHGIRQGIERGMAQGMERGMEQGIERGTAENLCKLVNNFMSRRKVTLEEACDALGISADDYNQAERLLNEHDFS
jgi:flagellar biosynthesis/type III secretory pathway protein FliH